MERIVGAERPVLCGSGSDSEKRESVFLFSIGLVEMEQMDIQRDLLLKN